MKKYTEKDFVDVVDEQGNDLPAVPKAWIGTDLLPPGVKKKGRDSSTSSSSSQPATREAGTEPAGNASREEWAAFATEKGAKPDDLVDDKGEPLGRDELKARYATPKD